MAFGFNLFVPFRSALDLAPAFHHALGPFTVDQVILEWIPPGRILGEFAGEHPAEGQPATGIDVLVRARRPDGKALLLLVEVKLTEGGFTHCNGATSRGNKRTEICASAERFLAEPRSCYLQRPVRQRQDRQYWQIFENAHGSVRAAFPGVSGPQCPFITDAQQPMRQYAAALGLVQAGDADEAWVVLVHHDDNPDVVPHWEAFTAIAQPDAPLARTPASRLLTAAEAQGHDEWATWMRSRYRLP